VAAETVILTAYGGDANPCWTVAEHGEAERLRGVAGAQRRGGRGRPDTIAHVNSPAPVPTHEPAQNRYEVRFDWGIAGLESIAPDAGVIVVIDAISFTTTVELAVTLGLRVIPFDGLSDASQAAEKAGAVLAGPRGGDGITLSPSSITAESVAALAPIDTVLIGSLNGSRVSAAAARYGVPVVAASLRNRSAVANWILEHQAQLGHRAMVAVVAAGEKRADGSLRFAVEDLLTAGSVIDALAERGIDYCSPEAAAASAAFGGLTRATGHLMTASESGRELAAVDQLDDVVLAGKRDVSTTVPVLVDGAFVDGARLADLTNESRAGSPAATA
jgi:2-phosphosulfolactate phosphatase